MQVDIKTDNLTITPAIDQYLTTRLKAIGKLIDPNDQSALAEIRLAKTTDHHLHGPILKAEINLRLAGWFGRAEATGSNLYNAINEMKAEIVRQLRKHKKKQKTKDIKQGKKLKDWVRGWSDPFGRWR